MERSQIADPRLAGLGGKSHDVARGVQQTPGRGRLRGIEVAIGQHHQNQGGVHSVTVGGRAALCQPRWALIYQSSTIMGTAYLSQPR